MLHNFIKIIFILISLSASAKVWESSHEWTVEDIEKYQEWVQSEVTDDIFSAKNSPYYGVRTDCADVMFALLAIYSFENNLKYEVRVSSKSYLSSDTDRFDNYNGSEKLIEFVNYIGNSIGSENLVIFNSYPIEIDQIKPGDFYGAKWSRNGRFTRHISLVKDIQNTGDLTLYSSTTPRNIRKLNVRKGYPLMRHAGDSWGFRRIVPSYLLKNYSSLPGYSKEQYPLNKELGDKFFSLVKNALKTEEDTLELNLVRRLENLCELVKSRDFEVKQAIINQNGCYSAYEYDLYSTVNRDKSIRKAFVRLHNGWHKIRRMSHEVSNELTSALEYFYGKDSSSDSRELLSNYCEVTLGEYTVNLKNVKDLILKKRLSSNPNLSYDARWGFSKEGSSCRVY